MQRLWTCQSINSSQFFRWGVALSLGVSLSILSVTEAKPSKTAAADSGAAVAAASDSGGARSGAAGRSGDGASKAAASSVSVELNARSYRPGETIQITLNNQGNAPIFLPGCASYSLERFQDERYTPITVKRCESEQNALMVPKGSRSFELPAPTGERALLRVTVTYGVDCREGIPLSRSGCKRFDAVSSSTFTLLADSEK